MIKRLIEKLKILRLYFVRVNIQHKRDMKRKSYSMTEFKDELIKQGKIVEY